MRNKITLSLLLSLLSFTGFCTVYTVTNAANKYTPDTLTITFGDSVNFDLTVSHDAREVSQTVCCQTKVDLIVNF